MIKFTLLCTLVLVLTTPTFASRNKATVFNSERVKLATIERPRKLPIIGGKHAGRLATCHTAYIVSRYSGENEIVCSATVLDETHLLSAAHFFPADSKGLVLENVTASTNSRRIQFARRRGRQSRVTKIYRHWRYEPDTQKNGIAILELESPVSRDSRSVVIPEDDLQSRKKVFAPGFGVINSIEMETDILREVKLQYRDYNKCSEDSLLSLDESDLWICAVDREWAEGGKGICVGDSGGPLYRKKRGSMPQYGISAFHVGRACAAPFTMDYFTRLSQYVPAIKRFMRGEVKLDWVLKELIASNDDDKGKGK